nr:hypothetical protein [Williamsoniiplasma lucivorax]
MYARGAPLSDIKAQLKELYQVDISPTLISQITDRLYRTRHKYKRVKKRFRALNKRKRRCQILIK